MSGNQFLQIPGPTNVPERVLRAMVRAQENHRSAAQPPFVRSILSRLAEVLRMDAGECFVFPASGSAMWEAALVNTLDPGARLLAVRFGQFSHLFIDTARRLGFQVDVIETGWGDAPDPSGIETALLEDTGHSIRGVLLVHNETATGVTSDISAVRRAMARVGHPALLYVDGVSSIASLDFRFSEWEIDLAITGSQKGFMAPAGLGILGVSERALARIEDVRTPRAYFDLRPMRAQNALGFFPSTPALTLLHALSESLDMLLEEGLDNVVRRHRHLANGVRAAVDEWGKSTGIRQVARDAAIASDTVTGVLMPDGVDAGVFLRIAYEKYNLALAGGLGELAGRSFRIGHLGNLNELMLAGSLAGIEMALLDAAVRIEPGSGIAAAMKSWRTGYGRNV